MKVNLKMIYLMAKENFFMLKKIFLMDIFKMVFLLKDNNNL